MAGVQVQVWQASEAATDQYFVEFKRLGGSSFLFYDTVARYADLFNSSTARAASF